MRVRENRVKRAWRDGRKAYGYNLVFPSPWVVEVLGYLDFDYVWIDGEHGPWSPESLEAVCVAAELVGITPIARVPDIRSPTVLGFLDRGVQGILGPHIANRADAEQLVRACRFGPEGERSFGGNRGSDYNLVPAEEKVAYYRDRNAQMLVGALLEDRAVIDELDGILEVPGIDYFSVGHNDFAQSLGYPGDSGRPEVQRAMEDVLARIRAAGARVGNEHMVFGWVQDMLLEAGRSILARS